MDPPETIPSHNQPPKADTLAHASKILLKGPWYSCLLWGYVGAWKHRSGCSQSVIGWNTEPPMEELEKVPKELKGSATLLMEQQYELTSTPRARVSSCICSRRWPSRPSLGREAPWSCKLYMPQYRGTPGPRSGSGCIGEWGGSLWGTFGIALEM